MEYFLCIVRKSVALESSCHAFTFYNLKARLILLINDEYHIHDRSGNPWGNNFGARRTVDRHAFVIFPQVKATRNCRESAKRGIQARSLSQRERFASFHQGDFLCEDRRIRKRKKRNGCRRRKWESASRIEFFILLTGDDEEEAEKISSACNKWLEIFLPLTCLSCDKNFRESVFWKSKFLREKNDGRETISSFYNRW